MGERIGGNRTAVSVKQCVSIACAHDGGDRKNPVAPGLFSTMTGFSQRRASLSANKRAEMSAPVPAGNGVMIRTLRCGQVSAREDVGTIATAVEATAVKTTRNDAMARMSSSGVSVDVQNSARPQWQWTVTITPLKFFDLEHELL